MAPMRVMRDRPAMAPMRAMRARAKAAAAPATRAGSARPAALKRPAGAAPASVPRQSKQRRQPAKRSGGVKHTVGDQNLAALTEESQLIRSSYVEFLDVTSPGLSEFHRLGFPKINLEAIGEIGISWVDHCLGKPNPYNQLAMYILWGNPIREIRCFFLVGAPRSS